MSLAYLGPEGTFSESAAIQVAAGQTLYPYPTVDQALDAVRRDRVKAAVVPIENSVEGSVSATLDSLASGDPLMITQEVVIPVRFALLGRRQIQLDEIRQVATHPHAHAQCRDWLSKHLPGANILPASSTAEAATLLSKGEGRIDAVIASTRAAELHQLKVLVDDIGDNREATTRFIVAAKPGKPTPITGADKTSLVLYMKENHPGALLEILTEFAVRGVDLSRIESRPTKKSMGDYTFSVDLIGHINEARVGEALMGLHRVCADVRFLGSYPRHDKVETITKPGTTDAEHREAEQWLSQIRNGDF
jgi:prephenate dehydratase